MYQSRDKLGAVQTILRGGTVFDGLGNQPVRADVAICDGLIVGVGDLSEVSADTIVDVTGKAIAPGFIDSHSHDDYVCISRPDMTPKISQGVTTVVVGNCGLSVAPLKFSGSPPEPFNLLGDADAFSFETFEDYAKAIDRACPSVNVVALVGHTLLRAACVAVMSREATEAEIARMAEILEAAMMSGAAGLSSGVYYPPARAAGIRELAPLAQVVARFGGIYTSHIRDEYDGIAAALEEAFDTARTANAQLLISHHKCAGVRNWGRSAETLGLIDRAAKQQSVCLDCYPYTAGSSVLNPDLADGEIEILINSSDTYPEAAGKYLREIAQGWGISDRNAAERLLPGSASYFQIYESDMRRILAHPLCMVGSDGLPNDENPHPRLWGTFPRVLGHCVRDLSLFPLAQAVAKMTGLPAKHFGLSDRGVIGEGMVADITVFDPEAISDRATFENPKQVAVGISSVFVNGILTWSDGKSTGDRAGRFIRLCEVVAGSSQTELWQ